ncbi:Glycerol-3-phosphate acyltransferase [Hyella patelloides LEGE 07179]|uniref:Glycerol-3-phosphate acyltransferase n=1 Tax=Hyella patelloides LEGE 07179 TaxID=945734 RepID=A0A563W0I8_9CYAN|nr:glycerol-3-phosphate 1-O-acyltransferase PlsY [Hyella patelloides]VEP17180.1 Glycerol-3-phosphate acyltransferase [Hyella patelloides LEGE 07179]
MIAQLIISSLFVIAAYLFGSFPTGYLMGKYLQGIDIREHGSGSTGATNVLRTIGKKAAIVVLLSDIGKGAIAVSLVRFFYAYYPEILPETWKPWLIIITALAAILGHSKSVWLNFTGGKSVATGIGVVFLVNPWLALGTLATFGVTIAIFRIVSLSSIAGAIAVIVLAIILQQPIPYIIFASLAGGYVIIRHSTNIQRILAGEEPKVGQSLQEN